MLFSSGGLAANPSTFVGVGAVSNTETTVQQVMSVSGHFTALYCFIDSTQGTNVSAWT